ncbi:MAG TPA: hypothetical protein ENI64_03315 [Gammaproteobacteria bacterium]|nr:hypothetical protein [Gammaproteobacteria bacterium]
MDSLRWILLVVGVAIIVVIYLTGRSRKTSVSQYWNDQPADGVAVGSSAPDTISENNSSAHNAMDGQTRLNEAELLDLGKITATDRVEHNNTKAGFSEEIFTARPQDKDVSIDEEHFSSKPGEREMLPRANAEERLIMLSVMAPDGQQYTVQKVREVLEAEGMEFGLHDIYHRLKPAGSDNTLYSISSQVEPGTLGPKNADASRTPGLALFMQLPGDFDPVMAYDDLIDTATRIKNALGADLCDEKRQHLSVQTMRYMRDQIIEYTHKNYIQTG